MTAQKIILHKTQNSIFEQVIQRVKSIYESGKSDKLSYNAAQFYSSNEELNHLDIEEVKEL